MHRHAATENDNRVKLTIPHHYLIVHSRSVAMVHMVVLSDVHGGCTEQLQYP